MINAFQDTFCYTLHFEQDYSTGGNNGSLIEKYLVAGPLSLSLFLFICYVSLFVGHFCHICHFLSFLSLCLFVEGEGTGGEGGKGRGCEGMGGEGMGKEGMGGEGKLKCQTSDIQTLRRSGSYRGAFALKKIFLEDKFLKDLNTGQSVSIPCNSQNRTKYADLVTLET